MLIFLCAFKSFGVQGTYTKTSVQAIFEALYTIKNDWNDAEVKVYTAY